MAVSTTNGFDGPYLANGATTSFPFTFTAPSADEVAVLLRAADGAETLGSGYTVTLGSESGGTVVFAVAPASGVKVIPFLDPDFTQEIAFADGDAWLAAPVNEGYDRSAARDQALKRDVARAWIAPLGEVGIVLPDEDERANKFLGFGADGSPLALSGTGTDAALRTDLAARTTGGGLVGLNDSASGSLWTTVQGFLGYLRGTTGAAITGANDASSGAKYTTVQGFLTYLLSSVGSGIVGFIHSLTGAVSRTILSKLRDSVSPEDFGAVGDGVTNDSAAMLLALQSGRVVDGNGRTYALGSALTPSSFVGLRNCNFKWANTTVMATQVFLLNIIDKSGFFVDNCTFDLGTVENTGDDDDSSRGGLRITTSNEFVTFNDHVRVTNCRAFGKGNGTGIYIRSCRWVHVAHNTVHDRVVAFSPDPSNDCQNGFDISKCYHATIVGNISRDQQTRLSGSLAKRYSRGFAFIELIDSTVTGCTVADVDQGFDFSGAITATLVNGNNNVAVSGCAASDCNTYGFKFANCSHDITVSSCVAKRFGFVGFVFSGPTSTPLDATKNTQRILLTGCHAFDPTGSFSASCYGFRLMQAGTSVGYPRGIRMVGCTVSDVTGGGKLYQGFNSDVTYDSSGHFNELIECRSIGHTDVASSGFTYTVAQLPASAPVGSRMIVTNANSVTYGSTVAGGGSFTTPVFRTEGDWKVG